MKGNMQWIAGLVLLLAAGAAGWWFGTRTFSDVSGSTSESASSTENHATSGAGDVSPAPRYAAARVYGSPRYLTDFALHDAQGKPFGRARLLGEWHLVFFGFTSCPDICPTTMATLGALHQQLSEAGGSVPATLFVSVDPERDDGEVMANYASGFHSSFKAATGPHPQLQALTLQMGAPYMNNRPPPDAHAGHGDHAAPQVDHSAAVFLIDDQARLIASFPPPLRVSAMAEDIRRIIDERG